MLRLLNNNDKEIVLNYLEKHHIECTFLIGNVVNFGLENDKTTRRCGDYFGFFEATSLKGIIAFYNLGSCIPHYEASEAVTHFSELIKARNINTLLGMEKIIKPLFDKIKAFKVLDEYSEDSYYINEKFTPFVLDTVSFHDAKELPFEDTSKFVIEAMKEGFSTARTPEQISKTFGERSSEEDFIFLIQNGEIRAQANIQTTTNKISQIGAVFTLEKERGKGYCKASVSEVCRRIISRGKTPTLMVRKNNTPAVKAYQALGFRHYDDYLIIAFKES